MTRDNQIVNQKLRSFTVGICDSEKNIIGTGIVVSDYGQIATCAHVVRNAIDGIKHPRNCVGETITVFFPQVLRKEEKLHQARIVGCLPDHDDDIVLLELISGSSPIEVGKYARIGSGDQADGDRFESWGFRRLDKFSTNYASGVIVGSTFAPEEESWITEPLQLKSQDIDKGMSGAALFDRTTNLVVGIISQTWYPLESGKDRDAAFGVNARVLSLEPLGLELSESYPRDEGAMPRLTNEQHQQLKGSPHPTSFDLSRAPQVLPEWVGRAELLAQIVADYANLDTCLIGLIGFGGEGKTSLARKALDLILNGSDQPEAVFWWSFYEQRSSDGFFEAALTYLGGASLAQTATSPAARAGLLAGLLKERRCVFVLDGFEMMQHDEGDDYGLIVSNALRDFLILFASPFHDSFCLITSRAPLVDLLAYTTYRQCDVTRLSEVDGRNLMRQVGAYGDDVTLDEIVQKWDGHALTLSLLGSYLVARFAGEATHSSELSPIGVDDHYGRVAQVLQRYDKHLSEAERAFLLIFSAFRLPVREDAFTKVFRTTTNVTILNRPLTKLSDTAFVSLVQGLVTRRLIRPIIQKDGTKAYTAHLLIRTYYAEHLKRDNGIYVHRQIADYYQSNTLRKMPNFPTLDSLAPYIEIVHHLCCAEAYENAFQIYWKKIDQDNSVLTMKLGAYETDLALASEFFPNGDSASDLKISHPYDKHFIINQFGLSLMSLGRLYAAVPVFKRLIGIGTALEDWWLPSDSIQNLIEVYSYLGEFSESDKVISTGLQIASQISDENDRRRQERMLQAWWGWVLHLRGHLVEAGKAFSRAELLERSLNSGMKHLYSLRGIHHADYLRRIGNTTEARTITEINLKEWVPSENWLQDESLCHRLLGDLDSDVGHHDSAHTHYHRSLSIARKIQDRSVLIGALLARGRWYAKHMKDADNAFTDLNEALRYAVESGYRIYEADIGIAMAWAYLRNGDKSQARVWAERGYSESINISYHWGNIDASEVLLILRE